jgi:hypothetical protein
VGDDEERRQNGILPDFREAIKAERGPREGARVKRAAKGQSWIWRNPLVRTTVDFAGRGLGRTHCRQAKIMRLSSQH